MQDTAPFTVCNRDASYLLGCARALRIPGQLLIRYCPGEHAAPATWQVAIGLRLFPAAATPDAAMEACRAALHASVMGTPA